MRNRAWSLKASSQVCLAVQHTSPPACCQSPMHPTQDRRTEARARSCVARSTPQQQPLLTQSPASC